MENKELRERLEDIRYVLVEPLDYEIGHLRVAFDNWVDGKITERKFTHDAQLCLDGLPKRKFYIEKRLDSLLEKIDIKEV